MATYERQLRKTVYKVLMCLVICMLLCFPIWVSAQDLEDTDGADRSYQPHQIISQVIVDIENAPVTRTSYEDMAKDLIGIAPGEPFSVARMEKAILMLEKSGRFEHIFADTIEKNQDVTVLFRLTPFPLIKEIRIRGAFPFFKSDILRAMTVAPGEPFTKSELPEHEKGIIAYLNREGYPSPTIHIASETDPTDGHAILNVNITKGPELTVDKVIFSGNLQLSASRLELKMRSDPTLWDVLFNKRFVASRLRKDIQVLTNYYRKKGFADCRIQHHTQISDDFRVSIFIEIEEGPLYDLRFEGNKSLSARRLKKNMPLFIDGNRNNAGLRRAVSHIKDQYQKKGFLQSTVKIEDNLLSEETGPIRQVTFVITEGSRSDIRDVQIAGNQAIKTSAIKDQMLTEKNGTFRKRYFNPRVLEEDINAIMLLYRKKGYLDASITPAVTQMEEEKSVSVQLEIAERIQTVVSDLRFSGLTVVSEKEAQQVIRLKPGAPFREYMLKSDQNALSAFISEKGYPFASVSGNYEITEDKREASVAFDVNEGQQVYMGQIYFTGNFKTKEKTLIKHMVQKSGEPFSLSKTLKSQKNLRDQNIFNSVEFNPIGLEDKNEDITLLVEVEERKPYYLETGVGYETQRGAFIDFKLGDRNLLGRNQEVWFGIGYSEIGQLIEFGLIDPWVWGTDITMNSTIFWERTKEFNQDFGTEVIGVNVGLSKKLLEHITGRLSNRFEKREQFDNEVPDISPYVINDDEFRPRTLFVVTPSVVYDTRDSFIQPKKGIFSNLSVDFSKGINSSLDDFIKSQLNLSYFVSPLERLVFAWIARLGTIEPYGSGNEVPRDQLFFLGGGSNVRGFDENLLIYDAFGNALGGLTSISASIEFRMDLGNNFELPLFFDTGKIGRIPFWGGDSGFRSSVGIGLRYITPIGPIGLLYGKKLDPEKGEPSGRYHFSIGYTF